MTGKGINKRTKIIIILLLLPVGILVPLFSIRSYHLPLTNAQESSSGLKSRISGYENAVQDDLSTNDQERIETRCLAVQTNIKALSQRLETIQKNRSTAYDTVTGRLEGLSTSLQNQAFDTSILDGATETLKGKIDTYKATMKDYKQAVDDMTKIDCTKEPVAFKGALEAARSKHADLITQVRDIREYVSNTIKPMLVQVQQTLAEGRTTGGL